MVPSSGEPLGTHAVPASSRPSLHTELQAVSDRFRRAIRVPRGTDRERFDRGFRADNLVLALPFLLSADVGLPCSGNAAREMAFANAAGAAHFLLQDDEIDGDARPSPERAALSDLCLMLFVRTYSALVEQNGLLWQHVDRYLGEYTASLRWERDVLRTPTGRAAVRASALPQTLRSLGRRLALLKTTCAASAVLSGTEGRLEHAEEAVDRFHAGYQLADDLDDLEQDLAAGRWTVPSWLLTDALELDSPAELAGRGLADLLATTGVGRGVSELIDSEYRAARDAARSGGFASASTFLDKLRLRAVLAGAWRDRRASIGAAVRGLAPANPSTEPSPVHTFTVSDDAFLYDAASGLFFEVDPAAADVLASGTSEAALDAARLNHGPVVDEAASELELLLASGCPAVEPGETWPPDIGAAELAPITALSLHVTSGCNLRCDYCYLGHEHEPAVMSRDTALRTVDLLMTESLGSDHVSLIFFGGEPLLEPDLVLETAERARERARDAGRRLSLHMTTNGTLLLPDVAERLHGVGVSTMVSLDGPAAEQNRCRRYPDGTGSYDDIARNIRSLPRGMRVAARATVTPGTGDLCALVDGILELGCHAVHLMPVSGTPLTPDFARRLVEGFEALARRERENARNGRRLRVGNFLEAVRSLDRGAPRLAPCGAGARYYSVQTDGTIVLCHRFAGVAERSVGSVTDGIDRAAARRQLAQFTSTAQGCRACWARYLCGGPCLHDAHASPDRTPGPTSAWCRVVRRVLELSMWVYAGLPDRSGDRPGDDGEVCIPEREEGRWWK